MVRKLTLDMLICSIVNSIKFTMMKVWHERYDYVNQLALKNLVTGMKIDDSISMEN